MSDIQRPLSQQPIPETAQKVFSGELFSVWQWEQKMYDGSTAVFEKIERADTVTIVPVTEDGRIILARQEQPGIEPFIGVLGGVIDPGEDPLTAAKRELLEEGGMEAKNWKLWFAVQPFSRIEWAEYVYIAQGVLTVAEQQLDPGEQIDVYDVPIEDFMLQVIDPRFRNKELLQALATPKGWLPSQEMKQLFLG